MTRMTRPPKGDPDMTWTRSSHCGTDHVTEQCVEAAVAADGYVLVRDSKDPATMLRLDPGDWHAFTAGIKEGQFDDLPEHDDEGATL